MELFIKVYFILACLSVVINLAGLAILDYPRTRRINAVETVVALIVGLAGLAWSGILLFG